MEKYVNGGTLYVVATPIGNLADITIRALGVLAEVDLIAAEDTRTSGVLLRHYNIATPATSFHIHNEAAKTPHLLARLEAGESIALITDGGLPVISDPGFPLIRGCYAAGIPVCVIPGATAGMAALAISGIPARRAGFEGFLPTKKGRRAAILENYANDERAIIIYESPHRLIATLTELHAHLGDRQAAAARELTKKFEEIRQGSLTDLIQHFQQTPPKGEFVLIISGKSKS